MAAVAGLLAVAPVASMLVQFVIADQSPRAVLVAEPLLDPGLERLIGLASVAIVIWSARIVIRAIRSGSIDRRWPGILLPLAMFSAWVGLSYAYITTPMVQSSSFYAGLVPAILAVPFFLCIGLLVCFNLIRMLRSQTSR